ncbi:MAG TPA: hypothetical protein QF509_09005 [Rhodospirillales bacterium]|jgi:hypothetical protein|nr:hypothetical protein [Rhodospirillales bacterium]
MQTNPSPESHVPDLADHFLACSKLGRYLTLFDESRFVITDDFSQGQQVNKVAAAAASIFSKDALVAQAALLPLGLAASSGKPRRHDRYDELFSLIEQQTLSDEVRSSAKTLLETGFRAARIKAIAAELGGKINPARIRYRSFLDIVKQLTEKRISAQSFREEFVAFTRDVAGRLDFGIYSFCMDRIFISPHVPLKAKGYLVAEIINYPPLIRRELITNMITAPAIDPELVRFTRQLVHQELDSMAVTEIYLLETLKSSQLTSGEMENLLVSGKAAALAG